MGVLFTSRKVVCEYTREYSRTVSQFSASKFQTHQRTFEDEAGSVENLILLLQLPTAKCGNE